MKMESYFLSIWIILIVIIILQTVTQKKEGFTPKIRGMYRPYVRRARLHVENFVNKYNGNYIINMLKKYNIY
jgi:hypothetical protein